MAADTAWDDVIDRAAGSDIYHRSGYHAFAAARGEGEARLLVYREGDAFIALPMLLRPLPGTAAGSGRDATSVYGYPGPLASPGLPAGMPGRFAGAAVSFLAGEGVVALFTRLNPLLDQLPVAAAAGTVVSHGSTVSLDLAADESVQLAGYRSNHRRDLRRLRAAGFTAATVPLAEGIATFRRLYLETMRRVGASAWYLFDEAYFAGLAAALPGRLELILAERDGEPVAGALFMVHGNIVQYHLGGTADAWLAEAPLKLVMDTARARFAGEGRAVLHLGGGIGGAEDALFNFKAGFSDRRHAFRSWRWIVRPGDYARLAGNLDTDGHFPAYRRPAASLGAAA